MKEAQKPDHVSLQSLLNRLKEGRYEIPDFQREFEWDPWDIRDLIRSIFLDYYIGSLLLWKGKSENFSALSCEPIYGHEGERAREHIVLDGQQRLTALYYACTAPKKPLPNRQNQFVFFIRIGELEKENYDEAFGYEVLSKRRAAFYASPEEQYRENIFPLAVMGRETLEIYDWFRGYEEYWRENSVDNDGTCVNAKQFGKQVLELLVQYQISYIELDRELEIDKICDIFTQINSKGVKLDIFDLMNALLKPKNLQLKLLWREAKPKLAFIDAERLNIYILQLMSILRQVNCSSKYLYYLLPGQVRTVRTPDGTLEKEVLVEDVQHFEELWNEAISAMQDTIRVLSDPREYGAIKTDYVPYVSILPCFAALRRQASKVAPDRRMAAHRKISYWYWASVFLNRYSSSVETTAARDFLDVTAWFEDDELEPGLIKEFASRFQLDLRGQVKKGTSIYNGIFNLLVLQGARDWATGAAPQSNDLDDHHIVPAVHAEALGLGDSVHSILNRTPISGETNRSVIHTQLPNRYLPALIDQVGRQQVETIMATHLISPHALDILLREEFGKNDFEDFIVERNRSIQSTIKELLIKERLDLLPDVRQLDVAIEGVELALRALVRSALEDDAKRLPQQASIRIKERIDKALRKSATMDPDFYSHLQGMLEYADLREVQDTIVNGALWANFSSVFSTKEELARRFDQLAEARNSIRHSRTLSEVQRRDGEAAIAWFSGVLKGKAAFEVGNNLDAAG